MRVSNTENEQNSRQREPGVRGEDQEQGSGQHQYAGNGRDRWRPAEPGEQRRGVLGMLAGEGPRGPRGGLREGKSSGLQEAEAGTPPET